MNKFKKFLLFCMSFVLAFSFLIAPFPIFKKNNTKIATSANNLIDENVLNYVTIATDGQTLTQNEIKNVDTNSDNKEDTSYVFANRTVTLVFQPLKYSYSTTFDRTLFYETVDDTSIRLQKLPSGEFPSTFEFEETTYSYQITDGNKLTIKNEETSSSFSESQFVSFNDIDDTRIITLITSYTLKTSAPDTTFEFIPSNSLTNSQKLSYTINFKRPIVDFKIDSVTNFTCEGLDIGETPYINSKIEKELSYEKVNLQFTNNDYTETNPLYFDINHDGFIYTFKLFSKNIDDKDYLFVEYFDEQKSKNNRSLATKLNEDGTVINDKDNKPVTKYFGHTTEFNTFSINFTTTGRYELRVYDETYLLNLKDYNFYTTSFYIKSSDSLNSNSAFKNAYAILQNYDSEGQLLDYIVSGSTQNNNVKIILKNLSFYFENDEAITNFTPTENIPDLNVVEFIKTTLSGSLNIPVSTYYNISTLKEMLESSPDFILECSDDAFYEIIIYQYEKNEDNTYKVKDKTSYQFTIVKQPKISFTVFEVDENNDRIEIPGTAKFKTIIREAEIPYVTVPVEYKINIDSQMEFETTFRYPNDIKTHPLDKTYLNEYTINYAMQSVKMEQVDVKDKETGDVIDALGIKFMGIGDISVKVTLNSVTTEYKVKSGDTLEFIGYGTYSVSMEDSMGTLGTAIFKYTKPVSTSTIILIVLVGVIALAIVLFIISSRGKLKTR